MVIDIVVSAKAETREDMGAMFQELQSSPAIELLVYSLGPNMLILGLLLLAVQGTVSRRVPILMLVLTVLVIVVGAGGRALDLPYHASLPVAAALQYWALLLVQWRMDRDVDPV
jgi:hypothetical protein